MMDRRRRRPDSSKRVAAAQHYRREAARLRALADESIFSEVKRDLADIAREYDALAQQREDIARRFGMG